ncbi:MAG: ATP-grasp domain-containing protein, partial [Microthrixaceae bacterium]
DKAMAKTVMAAHDIAQVPWRELHHHDPFGEPGAEAAFAELGDTVFVKPANMGSSIGVAKVRRTDGAEALLDAVKDAFRYDDVVVLEAGVAGRELEVAVLGNDDPKASEVGEVTAGADFYDYADKYFDGIAQTTVPADLDADVAAAARSLAVRTFRAMRCHGMARVDLFLTDDDRLLVNEVNTIPGFTPISMYPKMWEASGLGYPELIDDLVRLALERHTLRSSREVHPD